MMYYTKVSLIVGIIGSTTILVPVQKTSALYVNPSEDPKSLAKQITPENANVKAGEFRGEPNQTGKFVCGSTQGLMLSTGQLSDASGPNTSTSTSTEFKNNFSNGADFAGDQDWSNKTGKFNTSALRSEYFPNQKSDGSFNTLINMAGSGSGNYGDPTVLNAVFKWEEKSTFSITYVFASERYPEHAPEGSETNAGSGPNDVLDIAIYKITSGDKLETIDKENIAKTPNGDNITIANVNNTNTPEIFNANYPKDPSYNIEFDGFTDPLTAKVKDLEKGTYVLRIGLIDAGSDSDNQYSDDSAVFIKSTNADLIAGKGKDDNASTTQLAKSNCSMNVSRIPYKNASGSLPYESIKSRFLKTVQYFFREIGKVVGFS